MKWNKRKNSTWTCSHFFYLVKWQLRKYFYIQWLKSLSKLCHPICNTELQTLYFCLTIKKGLLQQVPQVFRRKQSTKCPTEWKCSCFPYHLHSHTINMGKFLKLKSQISSRFTNNLIQELARDNLILNFFSLIFLKTNKVRDLGVHVKNWKQVALPQKIITCPYTSLIQEKSYQYIYEEWCFFSFMRLLH